MFKEVQMNMFEAFEIEREIRLARVPGYHRVTLDVLGPWSEMGTWMKENLRDHYTCIPLPRADNKVDFLFRDVSDAVHFKMRWYEAA